MFSFEHLTLIIVIISLDWVVIGYCECVFQLYKDMDPHFQPVYFVKDAKKKSFSLATQKLIETRNYITIDESETLIITCPNKDGQQERYYEIDIFLECGADGKFKVTKGSSKIPPKTELNQYKCRYKTGFFFKKESHKTTQKLCKSIGKHSNIYHIGIYANLEQKWLRKYTQEIFQALMKRKMTYMWFTLYSICAYLWDTSVNYSENIHEHYNVKYTYYTINEEVIKNRQMKSTKFGDEDLRNPFAYWSHQTGMFRDFEKETMRSWMNSYYKGKLNAYVNVENHHFVLTPLVPEEAMSYSAWRYATHLTPNVVPMWKQVSCTWRNIEKVVIQATIQIGSTLHIYTGTYKKVGLLTEEQSTAKNTGKYTTVYFDKANREALPAIIWKLIYYEEKKQGVIFIFHNNPYRTDRKDLKKWHCANPNICKRYGWPVENTVSKLGETYCCDPRDFFDSNEEFAAYKKFFEINDVLRLPDTKLDTDSD